MSSWSQLKRLGLLYLVMGIVTATTLAAALGAQLLAGAQDNVLRPNAICSIHLVLVAILLALYFYHALRPRTVYLVDYACFRPSHNCRYPKATFLEHTHLSPLLSDSTVSFIDRILERSGMSDET